MITPDNGYILLLNPQNVWLCAQQRNKVLKKTGANIHILTSGQIGLVPGKTLEMHFMTSPLISHFLFPSRTPPTKTRGNLSFSSARLKKHNQVYRACFTTVSSNTQHGQQLKSIVEIQLHSLPSPHNLRRRTTAITVSANSCTESCKILLATSSPSSAEDTTTGTSAAIRAQEGSAYVHLFKIHE